MPEAKSKSDKLSTLDTRPLPDFSAPDDDQDAVKQIKSLGTSLMEHAYHVGRILKWVRDESPTMKDLKPEQRPKAFKKWIKDNVWFSDRTARRWITFADKCAEAKKLLDYNPSESERAKGTTAEDEAHRAELEEARFEKRAMERNLKHICKGANQVPELVQHAKRIANETAARYDAIRGTKFAPVPALEKAVIRVKAAINNMMDGPDKEAAIAAVAKVARDLMALQASRAA